MKQYQYKCRKHPQFTINKICLEASCYQCRTFDVELCEKCLKNHSQTHQTVSLDLFLEYLKMGISQLRIEELENAEGRSKDMQEIAKFVEYELSSCANVPKKAKQNLLKRVNQFQQKRRYIFSKIYAKIKPDNSVNVRIFSSRLKFHYARDLYLGLKMPEQTYSILITSIFKEELSLSLSFTRQFFQESSHSLTNIQQSISSHSCFMPAQCAITTNSNISLDQYPTNSQLTRISQEGKQFQLNLALFKGIQTNHFTFESHCFQPSYYMQKMFMVGKGYVAYQCALHLYYYNLADNQVQIIHSLPKLNSQQMMVEELNSREMCVFEGDELRIICKITGVTLCSQRTERDVTQIRALNAVKVAYFSQYKIQIWDRNLHSVTNTIKLNLLAIQDIIEISHNRVCIGANDQFLFIYDLGKEKFVKKLDIESYQRDRNINCDNLIFEKVNKNQILTSFRGSRCISFWNLKTYKCIRMIQFDQECMYSVVRLNCHALAIGCLNKFHIFDTVTGEIVRTIQTQDVGLNSDTPRPELIGCIYAYDDKTILTLSQNNIKIFN